MDFFRLEHSKLAYYADFALYALTVLLMAAMLLVEGPREHWLSSVGSLCTGLLGWTLIEYALHRFVLHRVQPFKGWHAAHHDRPSAFICTPTLVSSGLIFVLVFLPALLVSGLWRAFALTLGVLMGYLAYAVTHHMTHHWRADSAWLGQRKLWHAAHHHSQRPGYFGVTSGFWDCVLGSAPACGSLSVKGPRKQASRS